MPERRFVRRRNNIPHQASLVTTQEQARLLNDPAVPTDTEHNPTETGHGQGRSSGAENPPIRRTGTELVENKRAA